MIRRKLTIALVALAAALAVAELGWRVHLWNTGHGFLDDPDDFRSPFFTTYDQPWPIATDDAFWYRGGPVAREKPDREVRVLCLGGSTTVNQRAGVRWTDLLEKALAATRAPDDRVVRVLNAGGDGYSTAHSLVNLALRNLEARPDVVLVVHNVNDLSAAWFGADPTSDYAAKYRTDLYLGMRHRTGWIAELARVSRLFRFVVSRIDALQWPAEPQDASADWHATEARFRRNLRSIVAVARAHGASVVLASQPARSDYRGDPAFASFNRAIAEVAAADGAVFVDLAALVTEDALFIDGVHYTPEGVARVADSLLEPIGAAIAAVPTGR